MVPSYLRAVAGACLLTTGLLASGGAGIAVATPDTGDSKGTSAQEGSAPGSKGVNGRANSRKNAPNNANTATGPVGAAIAAGVGPAPSSIAPATVPSTLPSFSGKPIKIPSIVPAGVAVKPTSLPNLPDLATAAGTAMNGVAGATRDLTTSIASTVSSAAATAPLAVPSAAASAPAGPLAKIIQPIGALVEDVATAIIGGEALQPLMDVADQLLAGVSTVPAGTVPSALRNEPLPITLPSATSATQPRLVAPLEATVPGASVGPVATQLQRETPGVLTPQLLSNHVDVSQSLPPAVTPPAPPVADAWLGGIASQIFHGVREALRNVSVTELAWAALPGIAGLMFFFATGVGLGRRQAKFGFVMATSGAVRFAVRGPLGVVRNGSSIKLHRKSASPQHAATVVATGTDGSASARRRHLRLVDPAA